MLTGVLIRAMFISVAILCYLGCRNNANALFFQRHPNWWSQLQTTLPPETSINLSGLSDFLKALKATRERTQKAENIGAEDDRQQQKVDPKSAGSMSIGFGFDVRATWESGSGNGRQKWKKRNSKHPTELGANRVEMVLRPGGIGRDATGVPGCSWRCKSRRGYNGGNGGDGGDGQKAGGSGNGGTAKKVLLKTARVSGLFKVTKPMAVGGEKATNGNGASGGRGGIGGCGKNCEYSYSSMGNAQSKQCFKHTDCGLRGSTGSTGKHGRNGNDIYGQQNDGINGDDETDDLKTGSIKAWFSGEDDLLELIYRRVEFDFLKNRTDKALEIFDFLMSATDEGSSMHTKVIDLN
ncbi:unnamed protein product [Clavelina lepadiformis]|uniref:Uncharacterized protein n=1 Tax=Clavelina lepadiformis TaxID=159417 RepID=A0ABP0G9B0_CLALP